MQTAYKNSNAGKGAVMISNAADDKQCCIAGKEVMIVMQ